MWLEIYPMAELYLPVVANTIAMISMASGAINTGAAAIQQTIQNSGGVWAQVTTNAGNGVFPGLNINNTSGSSPAVNLNQSIACRTICISQMVFWQVREFLPWVMEQLLR